MEKTRMTNVEFVVNSIYKKAPLQKKKIENFLDNQDNIFFQEFEEFLSEYVQYLNKGQDNFRGSFLKIASKIL